MKLDTKERKKFRIRNKLKLNNPNNRMRLTVTRSAKNITAQIIDDFTNKTLISATSNIKTIKDTKKKKSELSEIVATKLAEQAKEKKITKVYFDRGVYKYHGRIKIFAETLRKKSESGKKESKASDPVKKTAPKKKAATKETNVKKTVKKKTTTKKEDK